MLKEEVISNFDDNGWLLDFDNSFIVNYINPKLQNAIKELKKVFEKLLVLLKPILSSNLFLKRY
jgi:site-specific DNA-adenine methylase